LCLAVPAPTAPLIGFVLGVVFAWSAADELARAAGSGVTSRSMVVVTLFSLLVYSPISAYFLAFAPDWSYAYVVDPQRLPSAVDLGLVLLDVASVPAGFALAARRASQRRLGPLVKLAAAPAIGALLLLVAGFQRLAVQGTYAQFHGDFGTRSVAGSPLGYSLLWMAVVLAGGVLWTARSLRRISAS
jgi:hypothetical protein